MMDKIAAVTGSANGIGRAIAMRLAKDGARVALIDRDGGALKEVVGEIEAAGGAAFAIEADLLKLEDVERAFAEIARKAGSPDILVNNVGQGPREFATEFWESDLKLLDWLIDLNLRTTLYCTRQVVPSMRERRTGRIVNIASEAAFVGSRFMSAYSAAKAGVTGFTRTLARELAPFGVNVNTVGPGYTKTRALQLLDKKIVDKAIAEIPLGFAGEPEDIAGVVAFFIGPDSRFVTGQCLLANGGRHMR